MFRTLLLAGALVTAAGFAAEAQAAPKNGLVVVNGDTGRVVYDDGYDDAFCVTRRRFAGYDWYGNPIFRRVTRCH